MKALPISLALLALITFAGYSFFEAEGVHTAHDEHHHIDQNDLIALQDTTFKIEKVVKTEIEWKEILTPEQFYILREQGTERPFSHKYNSNKEEGIYACAGCGLPLFSSETKYKSGSGWPSFWEPIREEVVTESVDRSYFMVRTEITCSRCGGHIGHVFNDGPRDKTGLRYCMNGTALKFVKNEESKEKS